ncbi:MAG TPA: peptide-methionine (R)-S-oxide reductase MsrB [Burkholderiales bacterium]|nr:peptide-methionine (R)-S-oxide reductase MsrB [Burkholderiales bacterium]
MKRRTLLKALIAAPVAARAAHAAAPANMKGIEELQKHWRNLLADGVAVPSPGEPLKLSKEEWKKRLAPESFNVLREEGTERPGSSPLNHEKRAGVFVCAGCGLPVFTSEMKFDSGTGWPSFFTTIPGVFEHKKDFLLIIPRKEYHCVRCGGHHGHTFDDGPAPTGERWCNNGVSLRFIPKSSG